jgi:hypothetical protein
MGLTNSSIAAIALVMLSSVFASTAGAQDNPPTSRWVELGRPHLTKRGDAIVLVQTMTSTASKDRFWALEDMNGPDESSRCDWLKTLEAKQAYRFECPLKDPSGQKYTLRVRVYRDAKLEDRELLYEPALDVTPQQLTAAENIGSAPAAVPVGIFESGETALPATFKPTWYRRVDKGFGKKAYAHSGDLTVSADELLFVDGKKTVRIPQARILSVRWEPLPNEIANHWVVVRFTNDEGKADGVASATVDAWAPGEAPARFTRPCGHRRSQSQRLSYPRGAGIMGSSRVRGTRQGEAPR